MNNSIWKVEERSSGIPYYAIIKNGITYKERGNEEKWKKHGWAQRKADKLNDQEYPYKTLKKLGIIVSYNSDFKMDYVDTDSFHKHIYNKSILYRDQLYKLLEGQTCGPLGVYPSDLDAALCKLETGKLIGSQKFWD